jgi:hypothetical protein
MKLVGYARPHPDLLPQEKEQPSHVSGFTDDSPANSVARISRSWRTIHPFHEPMRWNSLQNFASPEAKFCQLIAGKKLVTELFSCQRGNY